MIPSEWRKTEIIQLPKGKTKSNDLDKYRNKHIKNEVRKCFGELVTNKMKLKVVENVSKFQIGALTGHMPQEHIFFIKSAMGFVQQAGKGLILSLYDVSKFFNKENLRDLLGELYDLDVKGKVYRLLFQSENCCWNH